jgi:uncharacterized protein
VLSERGAPTPVAWTRMRVPRSLMAAIGNDAIGAAAKASQLQAKYGQTIDRESAYEMLRAKYAPAPEAAPPAPDLPPSSTDFELPPMPPPAEPKGPAMWQEVLKNPTVKTVLNTTAREITRSIFGTGRRRRS